MSTGINTLGNDNPRDVTLPRGRLFLADLDSSDVVTGGYRFVGNAPGITLNTTIEDLKHMKSTEGLKQTDVRVVLSQEVGMGFELDHINFQNLALFFSGETATHDNPHDTTFTVNVADSIVLGEWYFIVDDNGERVYNLDATGVVYALAVDPSGTPATLDATDYEIEEKIGRIRFIGTGTNTLADGDEVEIDVTTGASTPQDVDQVNFLTKTEITKAAILVSENAADNGQLTEYVFPKISISGDGDFALIGDEFTSLNFVGTVEIPQSGNLPYARTYDQAS